MPLNSRLIAKAFVLFLGGCATCNHRDDPPPRLMARIADVSGGGSILVADAGKSGSGAIDLGVAMRTQFQAEIVCKAPDGKFVAWFKSIPIGLDSLTFDSTVTVNAPQAPRAGSCDTGVPVQVGQGKVRGFWSVAYGVNQFRLDL
jgi:hypothetical protein